LIIELNILHIINFTKVIELLRYLMGCIESSNLFQSLKKFIGVLLGYLNIPQGSLHLAILYSNGRVPKKFANKMTDVVILLEHVF